MSDLTREQVIAWLDGHLKVAYEYQETHDIAGPWVMLVFMPPRATPRYIRLAKGSILCQAHPLAAGLWRWMVAPDRQNPRMAGGHARSEEEAKALCEQSLRSRGVLLS